MKKLVTLFVLLMGWNTSNAQLPEFSLHVRLFINNDSARTVIFGYDPKASDSMLYHKETWFSDEFAGGEQAYPPAQLGDLDFRMSGFYVNRPELGIDGSDGGPIDIRKKPALDSFVLKYGLECNLVPGTTSARIEWNPQLIPGIINHITLASYHFPHTIRLDMKSTSSFVFPLTDSGTDLYSNMILTLYYNTTELEKAAVGSSGSNMDQSLSFFPNPMDNRSKLHYFASEPGRFTVSAYDITGKKVFERITNAAGGENIIELQRNDFSAHSGLYLIRVTGMEAGRSFTRSNTIIVR
ncbi:MAG: T9SS type A sorting domain-containing protein [Bacteroidota bacterium]|nr:T9SS type A sorting domain-containing protein [Bacteroidota bacterium]MDP4230772.1 T9SS type A sorting domain-containing protein [Bacteroidota bacterium]